MSSRQLGIMAILLASTITVTYQCKQTVVSKPVPVRAIPLVFDSQGVISKTMWAPK